MLEDSEPQAGARPIGTRVWGKNRQASHAPGTLFLGSLSGILITMVLRRKM